MKYIHPLLFGLTIIAVIAVLGLQGTPGALASNIRSGQDLRNAHVLAAPALDSCTSGAHTLSKFGDRVYPEMGNGGYTSVHTDVHLVYDAPTNLFLSGTHVDLTEQATQCLTDFSLDFEPSSSDATAGPNMTLTSITVNGDPATFAFVQPTYPGDPNGQNDPDPLAHAVSNVNPVSATNPNPPACSPQVSGTSQNGTQCPANKLVITPTVSIANGSTFVVSIAYTGRPGVHHDGDGTTEGWFRSNNPVGDGGFVTTEPVGTEAWMPLNNHPLAKPTYDFYDTVNADKVAVANGRLMTTNPPPLNPPDANFPGGSVTWIWHDPDHIANYLVENSVGAFDLTSATTNGIMYYEAQGSSITPTKKASNKAIMDQQPDITQFQSMFNGPYPSATNGVLIGIPSASFEEEMQGMITFNGGTISLGTFNHENFHQWFGDNVSEASFNMTFWKEGWATIGEYLNTARTAATNAGGLGTPAGNAAFDTSLSNRFNTNYGTGSSSAWTSAPSNPTVSNLFTTVSTYTRPGTTYLALRKILDASMSRPASDRWIGAMKQIQSQYGGGNITEPQLEAVFHQWLPNQSAGCSSKLDTFFTQWFDTAYPTPNNSTNKPQITGPGINGPDHFYDDATACTRADQAINFGPLPDKFAHNPDFSLSAASDSGLTVSFTASGDCTVSGTTVHLVKPGSCTITASQDGDGVFKPAPNVLQSFNINFAPMTIRGQVYNDLNGNGVQEAGETGIAKWTVQFINPATSTVLATTQTDANGNYGFLVSSFGTYRVREAPKTGYVQTTPNPADITPIGGSDITGQNFGVVKPADLQVAVVQSTGNQYAGYPMTYTINLFNNGPAAAQNMTLTNALPANTTFVSYTAPSSWACNAPAVGAAGTFACTNPSMKQGKASMTLTVLVDPNAPNTSKIVDTATVASDVFDTKPSNNSYSVSRLIFNQSDVSIQQVGDSLGIGAGVRYTFTIQNAGPNTARSVNLTDALAATTSPASFTATQGSCTLGPKVTCALGDVTVGSTVTVTIIVNVTGQPASITNTGNITTATVDPHPADKSATAVVTGLF